MGKQTNSSRDDDWETDAEDMEEDLEIELDELELSDEELFMAAAAVRSAPWRRIDELREQRQLRSQLEDFEQYVI